MWPGQAEAMAASRRGGIAAGRGNENVRWPVSRVLYPALPRAMTIHLGRPLPDASCSQPGRRPGNRSVWREPAMPPLFGLAPGGVCRAAPVTGRAVRSYRTLSPLPAGPKARNRRFAFCGTFPGVAPAGRYPAPCFRGARTFLCPPCGKQRPSGHLTLFR